MKLSTEQVVFLIFLFPIFSFVHLIGWLKKKHSISKSLKRTNNEQYLEKLKMLDFGTLYDDRKIKSQNDTQYQIVNDKIPPQLKGLDYVFEPIEQLQKRTIEKTSIKSNCENSRITTAITAENHFQYLTYKAESEKNIASICTVNASLKTGFVASTDISISFELIVKTKWKNTFNGNLKGKKDKAIVTIKIRVGSNNGFEMFSAECPKNYLANIDTTIVKYKVISISGSITQ